MTNLFHLILALLFCQSLMATEPLCLTKNQVDLKNFFNSVNDVLSTTARPVNGFFVTSYNLKIEEDCKNRMPIKKLETFYRDTMAEGMQCLKNLSKIGNEGLKNNLCFEKLFADKSNSPKLLCGSWPFGKEITAVGSFPGSSKRHPYLWLSPEASSLMSSNPRELKATIFHEMLHNCGYMHSEGIEIPYTCEECCFNSSLSESKKRNACNICAGKYQNENDPAYVKELLAWSVDYPGWGRDMRAQVLDGAVTMKERANLEILMNETKLSNKQKNELLEFLISNDKEKINIFLKGLSQEQLEDRILKLVVKKYSK